MIVMREIECDGRILGWIDPDRWGKLVTLLGVS